MTHTDFFLSLPFPVTVCDRSGVIVTMNDAAAKEFSKDGGRALIGSNIMDCHSADSQDHIRRMMTDRKLNVYTTEKNGIRRLIYQSPWYRGEEFAGLIEMSFLVPEIIPNQNRD